MGEKREKYSHLEVSVSQSLIHYPSYCLKDCMDNLWKPLMTAHNVREQIVQHIFDIPHSFLNVTAFSLLKKFHF